MRLPNWLVSLLSFLLVVAVPPFLVLTNVNLFMRPQFVYYEYSRSDFPPSSRFEPADRRRFAVETVRYTRGELNDADLMNLGVYNERELVHMRDVQNLAVPALMLNYALGAMIGLAMLVLWRTGKLAAARRGLFNGAGVTLAIFGALGFFALVAFNAFFVAFHRVFFVGDSWLFAYTDSLIQFYPQPLWVDASLGIVIFTVLQALLLAGLAFGAVRRTALQPTS
jgi:integral membrane protein (TIGR01906 family)